MANSCAPAALTKGAILANRHITVPYLCSPPGPLKSTDWEWPAIHEAAHCVVADYFGHNIKFAWIGKRDGKCSLEAEWRRSNGKSERDVRLEEIVVNQSGRAALDRLHGCKHTYPDWHESDDHKISWPRALWLSDGDEVGARLLIDWAAHRAECLVEKLWPQIHRVAFALLEHSSLTGAQVKEILSDDLDKSERGSFISA